MNLLSRQIIAFSASIFILVIAIYSNYLPMKKSEAFIGAMRELQIGNVKSVNDFYRVVSYPLSLKSPFGQEEIVRQFMNYIAGIINQTDNPEIVNFLMEYINQYAQPILKRGKGLSFNQNVYLAGVLNLYAYQKTSDINYLNVSRDYFEKGYELSKKRPQILYGLFDICRLQKDNNCAKKIGDEILTYWPDDYEFKKIYDEFLKSADLAK